MMALLNMFLDSQDFFTFEAGQVIFQRGDASDYMYGIMDGEVEIKVGSRVLDKIQAGAVFGEMALIDQEPRSATAVALSDCRVVQVDEKAFHRLVTENPGFALDVMRVMSERLRRQISFLAETKIPVKGAS